MLAELLEYSKHETKYETKYETKTIKADPVTVTPAPEVK